MALIVASLAALLTVALMDASRLRIHAAGNTRDAEVARYVAEAGLHRGLSELEADITWRAGHSDVPFPPDATVYGFMGVRVSQYSVTAADGPDGTVEVRAVGTVVRPDGNVSRVLTATVKQGG
ncbi:hypothetical protein [Alienimonas californiensis]|uniref:hypothetical protein n=1 Tax=Alienimonas californiensis TaxID=2527989 RepID=UPI001A98F7DE|nr:hypothetical protein [Alienimonas californiensis]